MKTRRKPLDGCFHRILWDCDHPAFVKLFQELNPQRFMRQVKEAGFGSVGLFAKDSLGQSLYPTEIGHRHPGLFRDFLGEMTMAAKVEGLVVVAYYNCTQDPHHARTRPEWRECSPAEGEAMAAETTVATPFVCLHGGFTEGVLIPQLLEVAARYPIDGFFLDIGSEPQTRRICACATCRAAYRRETGRDLPVPGAVREEWIEYALWRKARHRKVQLKVLSTVREAHPKLSLAVNYAHSARQPEPPEGVDYLSLDVEEHTNPLLGAPSYMRHAKAMGLPVEMFLSHMQHWWWDWDLRPLTSMQLQAAEIVANGGAVCVGSNLHPTGRLDDRFMARLKQLNAFLGEREPFCKDAQPFANVAVLHSAATLMAQSAVGYSHGTLVKAMIPFRGAARILLEGHVPFQFLNEADLQERLEGYELLILPEQSALSDATVRAIVEFVERGGRLLAVGETASQDEAGRSRKQAALDELLGIRTLGSVPHPCAYGNFREGNGTIAGAPLLLEGTWTRVEAAGATVLADLVEPYHGLGADQDYQVLGVGLPPPGENVIGAAVTTRAAGKGRAAYIAGPVCTQHGVKTQLEWRDAMLWVIRSLVTKPLLETDAPSTVEIALARQDGRVLCHIINYGNEKGYSLRQLPEYVAPIFNIGITLGVTSISQVTCYPGGKSLEFSQNLGSVFFCVPRLDVHSIVALRTKSVQQNPS